MTLFCPECGEGYDNSMSVCPTDGVRLYTVAGPQASLVGEVLEGRFRIESLLGEGGMGAVYRTVQISVGRQVAVKVLHADFDDDQAALERFFREAKFVSELTHPSIVHVIDFGQEPRLKILYLVMELIEGPTLDTLIRGARLDVGFALEIAYQICGGLTDPHASHVVHRDLKPANLFVNPVSDGSIQVKICDFGIARALTRATRLTMEGGVCGTPAYMSPEQASDLQLDPRTDLYSLGVILYQMLTGWLPFDAPSSLQLMLKHIQETPPPFAEILGERALPASVELLVNDLMQKSADARPASARVVRERINRIRAELALAPIQLPAQLSAEVTTARDLFAQWIVPTEPLPNAPQPDSRELGFARTQGPSHTETQLLPPSKTQTLLIKGNARQTPGPRAARSGETFKQLAMPRVLADASPAAEEVAPKQVSAPLSQPEPKPVRQRTTPQSPYTAESAEKAEPAAPASSNRLLILALALILGALLLVSVGLGFLWLNAQKTSDDTPSSAATKTPEPLSPAEDSAPREDARTTATNEAAEAVAPEVEKPAEHRPKASSQPMKPAAPKPRVTKASPAKTPVKAPAKDKAPEAAAVASGNENTTSTAQQNEAPSNAAPPKSATTPTRTEASERLDSIFGNKGLRKE